MKYIKYFESVDDSDLLDIEDMFKDIADEFNLSKISTNTLFISIGNLIRFGNDDDKNRIKDTYCSGFGENNTIELLICIDVIGEWHTPGANAFAKVINNFITRCEGIGYSVKYKYEYTPINILKIYIK